MSEFGFKEITAKNWLELDEVIKHFTGMDPAGEYVKAVLGAELSEKVPDGVRALFAVARGAILYGYVFYPLYALGEEQLYRIGEAALTHRCGQLAMPKKEKGRTTFWDRVEWLKEQGVISARDAERWHALRRLRNSASHPERQSLLSPGQAMGFLYNLAEDISALFDDDADHH